MKSRMMKLAGIILGLALVLGLMAGMQIRPEHKKPVFLGALGTFVVTYIPLMAKFCRVFTEKE